MNAPTYTLAELAERWHVHIVTLRRKVENGSLPGFKVGKRWIVTAATVNAVEQNTLHI